MARQKLLMLENLPLRNSSIRIGSHHYAYYFSRHYDVLWISLPWHLLQVLQGNYIYYRGWNFNRPFFDGQLTSITPFAPLPYRNNFILKTNWYLENYHVFMPGLLHNIKRLGFDKPDIVWVTEPRHYSLMEFMSPKKLFYRCVDDFGEFQDVPNTLVEYEKKLMACAEAVFFTSKELQKKFGGLNHSIYLPNGCDYDFFAKESVTVKGNEAQKFFSNDKINVLYTGAIAEWFDFDALREAAADWSYHFVVVGPLRCKIPPDLWSKDNIKFAGAYDYRFMPDFTSLADIGFIPFKVNDITHSVNPIKLYEYSAAGLPTVVSNFKTVSEIGGPCFIYKSIRDIQNVLAAAVTAKSDASFEESIRLFARKNSWSERFSEILKRM
jgi:glycosyltransferase involved in cell wall biosynthesis